MVVRARGRVTPPKVLGLTSTTVLVRGVPPRGYNGPIRGPQPQESRDPRRTDPRQCPRRVHQPATRSAPP